LSTGWSRRRAASRRAGSRATTLRSSRCAAARR
jgi:hypothetical protein